MTPTTWHGVQPYVRTKKGRLDAGGMRSCHSAESAKKLAERLVETGAAVGALAYSRTAETDEGQYDEPEILARIGTIPGEESDLPF